MLCSSILAENKDCLHVDTVDAFILGAILNILFNATTALISRRVAINIARWGWLYFCLHATYRIFSMEWGQARGIGAQLIPDRKVRRRQKLEAGSRGAAQIARTSKSLHGRAGNGRGRQARREVVPLWRGKLWCTIGCSNSSAKRFSFSFRIASIS